MNIGEIFKINIELKKKIDRFLQREIYNLQGYDTRIVTNDGENFEINYYDGKDETVRFTREEFYMYILSLVNESVKANLSTSISIEDDFLLFISKKIFNEIMRNNWEEPEGSFLMSKQTRIGGDPDG